MYNLILIFFNNSLNPTTNIQEEGSNNENKGQDAECLVVDYYSGAVIISRGIEDRGIFPSSIIVKRKIIIEIKPPLVDNSVANMALDIVLVGQLSLNSINLYHLKTIMEAKIHELFPLARMAN